MQPGSCEDSGGGDDDPGEGNAQEGRRQPRYPAIEFAFYGEPHRKLGNVRPDSVFRRPLGVRGTRVKGGLRGGTGRSCFRQEEDASGGRRSVLEDERRAQPIGPGGWRPTRRGSG